MHRSPCSRVAAPSPNPTGGTEWPGRTSVGYNPPAWGRSMVTAWRTDRCGPPANLFQSPDSTALSAEDDHVAISGPKLSRPSLL
jgi:hypothetical protein